MLCFLWQSLQLLIKNYSHGGTSHWVLSQQITAQLVEQGYICAVSETNSDMVFEICQ